MTLRTVTYDTATHKIVPLMPTSEMKLAFEVGMSILLGNDEALKLAIAAAPEYQEPENPLDMPLPCDIKVGHGTIKKGCKLSTLVLRMNVLYDLAMKYQEPTKDESC